MDYEIWQWAFGIVAALMVGVSKTGVPGFGILVVTLLGNAFGARASVGIMLPMLIIGDIFAVIWYGKHTQWRKLVALLPWVIIGMACGAAALWYTGKIDKSKDSLNVIIGVLVIVMLFLHLLKNKLGERWTPKSPFGIAFTGANAGFATTISNAAGPVMSLYMAAHKVTKEQFVGTLAWYFFIINISKVPIFVYLSFKNPGNPMFSAQGLLLNASLVPAVILGVYVGKWLLPRISQKNFDILVIALAAFAAIKMITN